MSDVGEKNREEDGRTGELGVDKGPGTGCETRAEGRMDASKWLPHQHLAGSQLVSHYRCAKTSRVHSNSTTNQKRLGDWRSNEYPSIVSPCLARRSCDKGLSSC